MIKLHVFLFLIVALAIPATAAADTCTTPVLGSAIVNGQIDTLTTVAGDLYPEWSEQTLVGSLWEAGRPDKPNELEVYELHAQRTTDTLYLLVYDPTSSYPMDDYNDDEFFVKEHNRKLAITQVQGSPYLWEISLPYDETLPHTYEIHVTFENGRTAATTICLELPTAVNLITVDANETPWPWIPYAALALAIVNLLLLLRIIKKN